MCSFVRPLARRWVMLIVVFMVAIAVLVLASSWFLRSLGRGEFESARFNLDGGRAYVEVVRETATNSGDRMGVVTVLPPDFAHLSVGGQVLVVRDQGTGLFEVTFWARRGMQSIDAYIYREGPASSISAAESIDLIAPGWYFIKNGSD